MMSRKSTPIEDKEGCSTYEDSEVGEGWDFVHQSLKHHRLSKLYNKNKERLNRFVSSPRNDDVTVSPIDGNLTSADVRPCDKSWLCFLQTKTQQLTESSYDKWSSSDIEAKFSKLDATNQNSSRGVGCLAENLRKNLTRIPDTELLEDIVDRVNKMESLTDCDKIKLNRENVGYSQKRERSCSFIHSEIPKLDLSWIDVDDSSVKSPSPRYNESYSLLTDWTEKDYVKRSVDSTKIHSGYLHVESNSGVGNQMLMRVVTRSHCSSPELLRNERPDDDFKPSFDDEQNGVELKTYENLIDPQEDVVIVTRDDPFQEIIKKESQDSGFQESSDVHSNGNQNSKEQHTQRKMAIDKQIKHELIEEEKNCSGDGFCWNRTVSAGLRQSRSPATCLSAALDAVSIATSQLSFDVSRQGDTGIADKEVNWRNRESVKLKKETEPVVTNQTRVALKKLDEDLEGMNKWKDDLNIQKRSISRCYCFFCGLNCGIWFC